MTHPNTVLIGVPGGRAVLDTPALLIDLPALERNIAAMAAFARDRGVALRPHAKTHKSVEIARRQAVAGAVGICCATLGEAEVMVAGGIAGVLVTSPLVTPSKIARLIALNQRQTEGLMVCVDHPENVRALAEAAAGSGKPLEVIVDFSAGHNRTGCATPEALSDLVDLVRAAPALRFVGIQSYSGNLQHIPTRQARSEAAARQIEILRGIVDGLRSRGIDVPIVTGVGTGTFDLDPAAGVYTELQVGSYVFMDVDYLNALRDGRNGPPFETALFVQAAVVSLHAPSHVTIDGGLKCFATDGPKPEIVRGAPAGSLYQFSGDEHGRVLPPEGGTLGLRLGDRLEMVTPHCDPTVNLHDVYHVVDGDRLIALWPVDARGRR
jgi:D-serine deaminase-like pyridoxal phosphate-dependent protein